MKHFLLVPDSFKGTLTAEEICEIESAVIRRHIPNAVIRSFPMSDGGEGMTASYLRIVGGQEVRVTVSGPFGDPVEAVYGLLPDGSAVMEMAAAAGLPLTGGRLDPLHATTYGVGEMIRDAVRRGVSKILLGLGGSATNDCGIGMAAALGYRFQDQAGEPLEPLAGNLGRIASIRTVDSLPSLEIRAACDVDNPLLGPDGATYTFGPQKGVRGELCAYFEAGMAHYAQILSAYSGVPVFDIPGGGAAGGLGATVQSLFKGELSSGIDLLLDAAGFDTLLKATDIVFTGEGCVDWQSAHGKVLAGVGLRCRKVGVPCIALCGSAGQGAESLYECGITAVFSAVNRSAKFEELSKTSREDLTFLTDAVLRVLVR